MIERVDFETAWKTAEKQLYAVCFRLTRDRALTEDILQEVVLRAWRGYARFDWTCPVTAWLMKILKHQIASAFRRRAGEPAQQEPLDEAVADVPAPPSPEENEVKLGAAIAAAADAGTLSAQEARVLTSRIAYPGHSWPVIGAALGLLGTTCASIHSRAVPKFRTYLFCKRQSLLGGQVAIRKAFEAACDAGRLRVDEMDVFRRIVLEGAPVRGDGVRRALRSACAVVAQFLSRSGVQP